MLGIGNAKRFGTELMVLAKAAFLRALVPEIRADVVHLGARAFLGDQAVFDRSADNTRRTFGAERDHLALGAGAEGEGFLLNDLARLPDAPMEEFGVFVDRRADFGEVVQL